MGGIQLVGWGAGLVWVAGWGWGKGGVRGISARLAWAMPCCARCACCACPPPVQAGVLPCRIAPPRFTHSPRHLHLSRPSSAGATPNHALLLVGYSTQAAGQEHFIAKNSFGAGWGEAGFVRLAMSGDGAGMCGMYRAAFQPSAVSAIAPTKPGNGNADR